MHIVLYDRRMNTQTSGINTSIIGVFNQEEKDLNWQKQVNFIPV